MNYANENNQNKIAGMDDRDEILLTDLRSGNILAYERFFLHFYKPLVARALYILGDQMDAEDVVQVLFIEFWSKQHYLSIHGSLSVYLNRAIKNKCLNLLEMRAVQKKRTESLANVAHQIYEEDGMERAEIKKQLWSAVSSLSRQQQTAFYLIHAENMKYKDAAMQMGISINSLKTHVKLAVKSLRIYLKRSI